jgi:hypothetical protein
MTNIYLFLHLENSKKKSPNGKKKKKKKKHKKLKDLHIRINAALTGLGKLDIYGPYLPVHIHLLPYNSAFLTYTMILKTIQKGEIRRSGWIQKINPNSCNQVRIWV